MDEPGHTRTGQESPGGREQVDTTYPEPEKQPRFADSYGLVLLLLVATFFAAAVGGDNHYGRALTLVLLAATTWFALRASLVRSRLLRAALAVIPVATLIAVVMTIVGDESTAKLVSAVLTVILVVATPPAMVKRMLTRPMINVNTFYGAVCIYLLIAMFFATIFALLGVAGTQPFFAQMQSPPRDASTIDYLYFSFTTITTVGYGDLTAQGDVGRIMSVLEAVVGQLYLITVVALVVQNLSTARQRRNHR